MKTSSKIYVAGHAGLVGSAIMRMLKRAGYTNIITRTFSELDLRNQAAVENFFKQEQPEYVFLAAAKVGGILANNTYKAEFIYDNLMIATNIIHAAYKFGVKKLLNLGSSCIYPKLAPQPLKEEYLLTGLLEPTNEPYALAKIAAIKLCSYYNEQYQTNFMSVMPTNLYGPGDNFNLETAHVLPALIRKFYLAKLLREESFDAIMCDLTRYPVGHALDKILEKNDTKALASVLEKIGITKKSITLWGSGTPYREFLYVDDLAQTLFFLMKNYNANELGEFINIGIGTDITIRDLAGLIKNIVGFDGEICYDSSKPDGTPKKLLDISRLRDMGLSKFISLQEGIEKTYQWYHSKNLKKFLSKERVSAKKKVDA